MNPHPDADADLLLAYLEGDLPAEEARAVAERLKTDPRLAQLLLTLTHDEVIIREWVRTERAADETVGEWLHSREAGRTIGDGPARNGRLLAAPTRRRGVASLLVAAAAAVVVAATLLLWPESKMERGTELARLAGVQGEVWLVTASGQTQPAQGDEALLPGQEVRTGGEGSLAVVTYPDQTRLELGPDTTLRLEADGGLPGVGKRVFLQSGLVEAEVTRQPEGRPMVLTTPHAVIRVLGTRFSSTTSPEATWVELAEGRVELTRTSDGQSVMVEKDRFAVATPRAEPLVAQPLPPRVTQTQATVPDQPGQVLALAFSPDGSLLAVGSADGTVTLWDRRKGEIRWSLKGHEQRLKTLAFSPDGTILASGGMDKVLKFWDPATGTLKPVTFPKQKRDIDAITFSPDGTLLATALGYGKGAKGSEQIALWDPRTGKELARMAGHEELILTLAFAPDGKTLAASFKDGTVKLWDVEARRERSVFRGHTGEVYALAFAPGGKLLATAGRDRTVRLWDVQTGEARQVLQGHTREVRVLGFSPDGRLLASAGNDGLVRLWDTENGAELRAFKGHGKGGVLSLAFSPDGTLLATGGPDRRVLLWAVAGQ